MRQIDLGSPADPLISGNPLRLDVVARVGSGQPVLDLTGVGALRYALFTMVGDLPASIPTFVLDLVGGISVTSATGGAFAIELGSHTALWSGRDWHACRLVDAAGLPLDLLDGFVVSTRALTF